MWPKRPKRRMMNTPTQTYTKLHCQEHKHKHIGIQQLSKQNPVNHFIHMLAASLKSIYKVKTERPENPNGITSSSFQSNISEADQDLYTWSHTSRWPLQARLAYRSIETEKGQTKSDRPNTTQIAKTRSANQEIWNRCRYGDFLRGDVQKGFLCSPAVYVLFFRAAYTRQRSKQREETDTWLVLMASKGGSHLSERIEICGARGVDLMPQYDWLELDFYFIWVAFTEVHLEEVLVCGERRSKSRSQRQVLDRTSTMYQRIS